MIVSQNSASSIIIHNIENFSLDQTFECGQCFRWNKIGANTYIGIAYGNPLILRQLSKHEIELFTTESEFNSFWSHYFDVDKNYGAIKNKIQNDKFLSNAADFGWGIRILKQEPWEALISFITSQQNNIPRIKKLIDSLSQTAGEKVEYMGYTLYKFPTPKQIVSLGESGLTELGFGYRSEYIYKAASKLAETIRPLNLLHRSNGVSYEIALSHLLTYKGVGDKVANCVALFGLGHTSAFPIDVWIKKVIADVYNGTLDIAPFGEDAGVIQQYMFYYMRAMTKK